MLQTNTIEQLLIVLQIESCYLLKRYPIKYGIQYYDTSRTKRYLKEEDLSSFFNTSLKLRFSDIKLKVIRSKNE